MLSNVFDTCCWRDRVL